VFQVTHIPADALSTKGRALVSQAKGGDQGPSASMMAGLAGPFKYIHLLVTYLTKILERSVNGEAYFAHVREASVAERQR